METVSCISICQKNMRSSWSQCNVIITYYSKQLQNTVPIEVNVCQYAGFHSLWSFSRRGDDKVSSYTPWKCRLRSNGHNSRYWSSELDKERISTDPATRSSFSIWSLVHSILLRNFLLKNRKYVQRVKCCRIRRNIGYKLAYLLVEAGYLPEYEIRHRVLSYLDDEKKRKMWRELGLSPPSSGVVNYEIKPDLWQIYQIYIVKLR